MIHCISFPQLAKEQLKLHVPSSHLDIIDIYNMKKDQESVKGAIMINPVELAYSVVNLYKSKDPFYIAEQEGILIMTQDLPSEVSGMAVICFGYRYIILSSHITNPIELKMICAHELGHLFLHQFSKSCFDMMDDPLQNTIIGKNERQANLFAAHLLIDPQQINEGDTREIIAYRVGVPIELLDYFNLSKDPQRVIL